MRYLFVFVSMLVLSGCINPAQDLGFQTKTGENISAKLSSGQEVTYVEYEKFGAWLASHRSIHIDSLASVDKNGHGSTSGYMIVYTPFNNPFKAQ